MNAELAAKDSIKIAVIGGDGTGPEVVAEGLKVLEAVATLDGFSYELTAFDFGGDRYLQTGEVLPEGAVEELSCFDAIYLGAVGHPDVAPGILEKGLLLELRFQLDQYINLRPVKLLPGVETPLAGKGPEDIDFVVVRENTEDLYCGVGGFLKKGNCRMKWPVKRPSTVARVASGVSAGRSNTRSGETTPKEKCSPSLPKPTC